MVPRNLRGRAESWNSKKRGSCWIGYVLVRKPVDTLPLFALPLQPDGTLADTAADSSTPRLGGFDGPGDLALGRSLTAVGDVDGDGAPDLGVGGTDAVFLLHLDASATAVRSWSRIGRERLANPDVEAGDDFGASFAALGDVNQDGVGDFVVGTPGAEGAKGGLRILHSNACDNDDANEVVLYDGFEGAPLGSWGLLLRARRRHVRTSRDRTIAPSVAGPRTRCQRTLCGTIDYQLPLATTQHSRPDFAAVPRDVLDAVAEKGIGGR